MSIIKNRYLFLGFSGTLVILSWIAVATFGLKQGIDLKGGAEWQISFPNAKSENLSENIKNAITAINPNISVFVKTAENKTYIVKLPETNEVKHVVYLNTLQEKIGEVTEVSFYNIGPSIGQELKNQAIKALIFVLLGISIYIAWAFRKVSKPVASWKYGLATLLTLFHDVSIPTGLLAILGHFQNIEIDTNFIVALLVVIGFSVHDTIVVFDRIRENLLTKDHELELGNIIDKSVKETFARSVNTSLTLIVVLVALLVWGPPSLFYFILVILIGTIFGTYSSIFIASPLIYLAKK